MSTFRYPESALTRVAINQGNETVALKAAAAGYVHRVIALALHQPTGTATFKSNATGLTGAITTTAAPVVWGRNEYGWLETAAGEALNLTTTGASDGCAVIATVPG